MLTIMDVTRGAMSTYKSHGTGMERVLLDRKDGIFRRGAISGEGAGGSQVQGNPVCLGHREPRGAERRWTRPGGRCSEEDGRDSGPGQSGDNGTDSAPPLRQKPR